MSKTVKSWVLVGALLGIAACQSGNNTMYYWGNYSDTLYAYFNEKEDLAKQEDALWNIINEAKEAGKLVGPGVYAQLGLVYLKQGNSAEAENFFLKEKEMYPDSAAFIDFLRQKNKGNK